jgi:hypothetical protein
MIEFKSTHYVSDDFTGVCKVLTLNQIRHYQNGELHREDGPAIEYADGSESWFYKEKCYGFNDDFTIETWKEKVEKLKRKEELKIFK